MEISLPDLLGDSTLGKETAKTEESFDVFIH